MLREKTHVLVLGSGPSGYTAAFRCSDLGLDTMLVESNQNLGGVCLNFGCIPSKILLNISKVLEEIKSFEDLGFISSKHMKINLEKINNWKNVKVFQMAQNLKNMAKLRKIKIIYGYGEFLDKKTVQVKRKDGSFVLISFNYVVIAVGSSPIKNDLFPKYKKIWTSDKALELKEIPKRLLIVGGGVIGLEMATVYKSFGSTIDIVEKFNQIIPMVDEDIASFFVKVNSKKFNFMLETEILDVKIHQKGIYVSLENKQKKFKETRIYDAILIAIGRIPNGKLIGAEKAGIEINNDGFIVVNDKLQTNIPNIFAIGDVIGNPMLAHKGMYEGHIVAESISGKNCFFDAKIIPAVAYTNPEVAWVGLTEKEAKKKNISYEVSIFPWKALGRAISSNHHLGITKLIFEKKSNRIIGGAIVGENSSELLGEIGLSIEMSCDAQDIAMTIHAHPTLCESIRSAAEVFTKTIVDLPKNYIETERKTFFK